MTKLTSILLAALRAGGPATLGAQTNTDLTTDGGYPRLSLYGHITGSGWPYIATNGVLDDAALDAIARYDEVILDVNPLEPYHPEILTALRQRHPGIRILAYVLGHDIWAAADADDRLDGVVCSAVEHKAVLDTCKRLEREGFQVEERTVTVQAGETTRLRVELIK